MSPDEIPGWFTSDEANAVARAALGLHAFGVLFEVGTWCGRSAAMLSSRLPDWKILTFDDYERLPDPSVNPAAFAAHALEGRNVKRYTSWAELPEWARFDVLLLDGNRTAEDVQRDLTLFTRMLADFGLLFLQGAANGERSAEAIMAGFDAFVVANRKASLVAAPAYEAGSLRCFRLERLR